MRRRDFFEVLAIPAVASGLGSSAVFADTAGAGDVDMVGHCRRILEQNLLKAGERLIVATSHQYEPEFIGGLLTAGSEIGAVGGHIAVLPRAGEEVWFSRDAGASRGLTPWHWDLYASADLLIVASAQAGARVRKKPAYSSGLLPVMTSYEAKLGDHPYRTDFERINREGSKTRWLKLGGPLDMQVKYFPNAERTERTLRAARLVDKAREIRVTSASGTDFRARKEGRPAHAQYGIADVPGRWDNFLYGCIVVGPQEYSAEGVVVVEAGDVIQSYPGSISARDMTLTEPMRISFEGGYVTKVEGGKAAARFQDLLASFKDKESFGISHVGFGTHEKAERSDVGFYHHNGMGSILFSLGANHGHGLGGEALKYSGLGMTTRKAPSHSHFAVYRQDFHCDGTKVVEAGKLLLQ
jgi:2,5-dihydroxypyridine 5,6-dioxygenase